MRRESNRLTVTKIKAALRRAPEKGRVLLNDGNNLNLQIQNRVPSWILRYQLNGSRHSMGLGPLDAKNIDLAAARERAEDYRRLIRRGIDPLAHKRSEEQSALIATAKAVPTFAECARRYVERHRAKWTNAAHAAEWPASLERYAVPVFGKLPVDRIDVALVVRALEPIWEKKPVTAGRVRDRIANVLAFAKAAGFRSGDNPAEWSDDSPLKILLGDPKKDSKNHPALPHQEIAGFMAALRQDANGPGAIAAAALEFNILTCARSKETLGARWDEFDPDLTTWSVPKERMKNRKPWRVPLSPAARAVVQRMQAVRQSDYVFPGVRDGQPLGHQSLRRTLKALKPDLDVDVHGFRSSFSTWAAENSFPWEIREMALAHTVGAAQLRAYQHSDLVALRRKLAEAWALYCSGQREAQSDHRMAA